MGMKFLNKKGWHTGSLRNIENVWKAEQKHEAEQRKLEELKKQIAEERERDEFRLLQEQAGLTPRQERLEFLYDSGLAVGKSSSGGFQELQSYTGDSNVAPSGSAVAVSASAPAPAPSSSQQSAVPGALFEDKPQSANDAWRKLHSDPLLMIRQREQEALAKIKNNPVKMAMIRKSMEAKKKVDEAPEEERRKSKSKHKKRSISKHHSDSETDSHEEVERKKRSKHKMKEQQNSDEESRDRRKRHSYSHREHDNGRERHSSPSKQKADRYEEDSRDRTRHYRHSHRDHEGERRRHSSPSRRKSDRSEDLERTERNNEKPRTEDYPQDVRNDKSHDASDSKHSGLPPKPEPYKRRNKVSQLSEEERAARLREMQMDAELHEEERWKRLKKAAEDEAREAKSTSTLGGRSFLYNVQKSVYGAEPGGSTTIEESVRRRTHFLQGKSEASEHNAFRR